MDMPNVYPVIDCVQSGFLMPICRSGRLFGDDELGRMMRLCSSSVDAGSMLNRTTPPPRIPKFREGWEACTKVWAAWLDSEDARKQREYAEKAESDRQSVIEFAKGLK